VLQQLLQDNLQVLLAQPLLGVLHAAALAAAAASRLCR
jgi:hypothetical protein